MYVRSVLSVPIILISGDHNGDPILNATSNCPVCEEGRVVYGGIILRQLLTTQPVEQLESTILLPKPALTARGPNLLVFCVQHTYMQRSTVGITMGTWLPRTATTSFLQAPVMGEYYVKVTTAGNASYRPNGGDSSDPTGIGDRTPENKLYLYPIPAQTASGFAIPVLTREA